MTRGTIVYVLTWVGTRAWVICFWWMHGISARQDAVLIIDEQEAIINHIAEQVTQVADTMASPHATANSAPNSYPHPLLALISTW